MNDARLHALMNMAKSKSYPKSRMPSKSASHEYYKAKRNKKKLPTYKHNEITPQEQAFRNMSIKGYEDKYL